LGWQVGSGGVGRVVDGLGRGLVVLGDGLGVVLLGVVLLGFGLPGAGPRDGGALVGTGRVVAVNGDGRTAASPSGVAAAAPMLAVDPGSPSGPSRIAPRTAAPPQHASSNEPNAMPTMCHGRRPRRGGATGAPTVGCPPDGTAACPYHGSGFAIAPSWTWHARRHTIHTGRFGHRRVGSS
jgi:hypothetical protein